MCHHHPMLSHQWEVPEIKNAYKAIDQKFPFWYAMSKSPCDVTRAHSQFV
jgi:hypothetical protein